MNTADFDYELPPELIAQRPLEDRAQARMLVVDRRAGTLEHRIVQDLPQYLRRGDLLVVKRHARNSCAALRAQGAHG